MNRRCHLQPKAACKWHDGPNIINDVCFFIDFVASGTVPSILAILRLMIALTLAPIIPVINWLVRFINIFLIILLIIILIIFIVLLFSPPSSASLQVCEGRSQRQGTRGEGLLVLFSEVLMVGIYYYMLSKFSMKIWQRCVSWHALHVTPQAPHVTHPAATLP